MNHFRAPFASAFVFALACSQGCSADSSRVERTRTLTQRLPITIEVTSLSERRGYAGASVTLTGTGFGAAAGKVFWGDQPCAVTAWDPAQVTAYLPDEAAPGANGIVVRTDTGESAPTTYTVIPPEFTPTKPMKDALAFVRDKMRNPDGGVYTSYKDTDVDDGVYLAGHNVTSEHMGLTLWASAAMLDHKLFEQSYKYVVTKMQSAKYGVISYGIGKDTGTPVLSTIDGGDDEYNVNSPLDDLRVANGFIAGWMQWKDARYRNAAIRIGRGLVGTSVSDSDHYPKYPDGMVTTGFYWQETSALRHTEQALIPVDYSDLYTMKWFSLEDPRWSPVVDQSVKMMEDAQLPNGQFWNTLIGETTTFSGDFEYRDSIRGQKIKTIQSLWTAIHLARVGRTVSAQKALNFYKNLYVTKGRVAEYLNTDGTDPVEVELADTLKGGEARIYSQIARLAYYLGDKAFASRVVSEKVVTDRETDPSSPLYGSFGKSTSSPGDTDAFNTLESVLGMAINMGSSVVTPVL